MPDMIQRSAGYADWVRELKARYQAAQIKAAVSVNQDMLMFYWSLGKDIVEKDAENTWGSGFYRTLSADLKKSLPEVKGFSERNLHYMKAYYLLTSKLTAGMPQPVAETPDPGNLPQPVAKTIEPFFSIPWGHIRYIIDGPAWHLRGCREWAAETGHGCADDRAVDLQNQRQCHGSI